LFVRFGSIRDVADRPKADIVELLNHLGRAQQQFLCNPYAERLGSWQIA
jgi:hypothetical protein